MKQRMKKNASAGYFLTCTGKVLCEASLHYFANIVNKEKVLLSSFGHLLSSVKATKPILH